MNDYGNLPEKLVQHPYWCVWRYEDRGEGKPAKVPYSPKTRRAAKVDSPKTFGTFQAALKAYQGGGYDGLGILLGGGLCAFDIDHCMEEGGGLSGMAQEIVDTMDCYVETSPSGKGIRGFFLTGEGYQYDRAAYYIKKGGLEVYTKGTWRFVTVTGNTLPQSGGVEMREEELSLVLEKHMRRDTKTPTPQIHYEAPNLLDYEIVGIASHAKNKESFSRLWKGEWEGKYSSQSEADQALCNILAFYTGPDGEEQLDRLFRQSGLMRNKWEKREDYRNETIRKAIDGCKTFYQPKMLKNGKKIVTTEDLKGIMGDMGITARYNVITKSGEYEGMPPQYSRSAAPNVLPVLLSDYAKEHALKISKNDIEDCLTAIMDENRTNPLEDMILGTVTDGGDRITELEAILSIDGEQEKTYLRKWLHQCVALALNDDSEPYGADGVLVLHGEQGIGKTLFFRTIACKSDYFAEGVSIDMEKKDTIIQATSAWIAELGELESTLKREQSALKAFITSAKDTYRVPYGRTAVKMPRRTSFCATVNPDQFLNDESGSRRFWVVHVDHIDVEKLLGLSSGWKEQLWRQVYEQLYLPDPQGFRLTVEERRVLQESNTKHEKQMPGVMEIMDQLDFDAAYTRVEGDGKTVVEQWKWYRVRDVMNGLELKGLSAVQVGKALAKIALDDERIRVKNVHRVKQFYLPPRIMERCFQWSPWRRDDEGEPASTGAGEGR